MDLKQFEQVDSYDYTLETPKGQVLDVVFTIAGPTHPNRKGFQAQAHKQLARAINRRTGEMMPEDQDEFYARTTDNIVNAVLGWKNLTVDGEELKFSAPAARAFFTDDRFLWVRERILLVMNDAANFIPRSSSS